MSNPPIKRIRAAEQERLDRQATSSVNLDFLISSLTYEDEHAVDWALRLNTEGWLCSTEPFIEHAYAEGDTRQAVSLTLWRMMRDLEQGQGLP